jgi:hypothetical protein
MSATNHFPITVGQKYRHKRTGQIGTLTQVSPGFVIYILADDPVPMNHYEPLILIYQELPDNV